MDVKIKGQNQNFIPHRTIRKILVELEYSWRMRHFLESLLKLESAEFALTMIRQQPHFPIYSFFVRLYSFFSISLRFNESPINVLPPLSSNLSRKFRIKWPWEQDRQMAVYNRTPHHIQIASDPNAGELKSYW